MMLPPSLVNIYGDILRAEDSLDACKARLFSIEQEYEAICLQFNNYAVNSRRILHMDISEQPNAALRLVTDLAKEGQ